MEAGRIAGGIKNGNFFRLSVDIPWEKSEDSPGNGGWINETT
jgi:hypothetical protein